MLTTWGPVLAPASVPKTELPPCKTSRVDHSPFLQGWFQQLSPLSLCAVAPCPGAKSMVPTIALFVPRSRGVQGLSNRAMSHQLHMCK